jgi:hypothetical protein
MKHTTEDIQKHVPITDLLREENTNVISKELVDKVLELLEDGFYKKYFVEQQTCINKSSDPTEPEESPNIHKAVCEGRECRIFMGPTL